LWLDKDVVNFPNLNGNIINAHAELIYIIHLKLKKTDFNYTLAIIYFASMRCYVESRLVGEFMRALRQCYAPQRHFSHVRRHLHADATVRLA